MPSSSTTLQHIPQYNGTSYSSCYYTMVHSSTQYHSPYTIQEYKCLTYPFPFKTPCPQGEKTWNVDNAKTPKWHLQEDILATTLELQWQPESSRFWCLQEDISLLMIFYSNYLCHSKHGKIIKTILKKTFYATPNTA